MPSDEAPIPKTPADPQPDPWAPPQDRVPTPPTPAGAGDAIPGAGVALDKQAAPGAGLPPTAPSVHDQMTVASMPVVRPSGPIPAGAGGPTPPRAPTPAPWAGPDPFAPPGGPLPGVPSAAAPDPFAPPAPHASYPPPVVGVPHAAVPPPPLSPEGPGPVPYGYPPQYRAAYPGDHAHPGMGYPAPVAGYAWPATAAPPSNGMGIAAMVLGICAAALFCLWPLAILLGVMAVIFGSIGRVKARRGEATNPGHALAGIICGVVGILLGIGFIVLLVVAPGSADTDSDTDPFDDGYSTSLSL
ncbi:DUF4190 domain-containing protein [Streptomyces stelliscabiei]